MNLKKIEAELQRKLDYRFDAAPNKRIEALLKERDRLEADQDQKKSN